MVALNDTGKPLYGTELSPLKEYPSSLISPKSVQVNFAIQGNF